MKLSSRAHYGLMACFRLSIAEGGSMSAKALEGELNVSGKYLEKIMRMLSARGIISANRGASGGYYLARPSDKITVGEIVRALEDDMEIIECVKTDAKCKCCPTSLVWKKLYRAINETLDSITLKNITEGEI